MTALRSDGSDRVRSAPKASIGEVSGHALSFWPARVDTAEALDLIDEIDGARRQRLSPAVLEPGGRGDLCGARQLDAMLSSGPPCELEQVAFATGAVDLLVTTYRACPELLAVLLRATPRATVP